MCPACGFSNAPEDLFCRNCGSPLAPAAPPAAGAGPPPYAPPYGPPAPPVYPGAYPGPYPAYPAYPYGPPPPRRATVSDMLSGLFDVWSKNFLAFFLVYLVLALITSALSGFISVLFLGSFQPGGGIPGSPIVVDPSFDVGALVLFSIAAIVLSIVLNSIVLGGMTEYAVRRYRREPMTLEQALRRGLERFLSVLGANLLVTLIIFALVLLPLLLILPVALLAGAGGIGASGALALLCGLLLAFVVGGVVAIFVFVSLSLYAPAIMMENARAVDSLSRSWALTKGHRWSLFAAILVTGLLVVVISALITFPASFSGNIVVLYVAVALASGITAPLFTILFAVAYDAIVRPAGWMPPPVPYPPMPPMAPAAPPGPPAPPAPPSPPSP